MNKISCFLFFGFCLYSCTEPSKKITWLKSNEGYYFQLLDFEDEGKPVPAGSYVQLNVSFSTQADSVFWDSYNNFSRAFYLKSDTSSQLSQFVSIGNMGDSVCLLLSPETFFNQQFGTDVPFFSIRDTVVKLRYRIVAISDSIQTPVDLNDLREASAIRGAFASENELKNATDPAGFYWLQRPQPMEGEFIKPGEEIKIHYEGHFLNGRYLESSRRNFEFVYGTPDQVLPGINYVIGRLKRGQNAKIILPSRLAFGEYGSSDGSVPPHTPLIYEIKIIQ